MKIKFMLLFIIFILAGCQEKEANDQSKGVFSPTQFEVKQPDYVQKFQVIPAYRLIPNYTSRAEKEDDPNLVKLFSEEVTKPVWNECFKDGEYLPILGYYLQQPKKDFKKLLELNDELTASNIENTIKEALEKSSEYLQGPDTNVCIFPSLSYNDPAKGVNVGAGKIAVLYNKISFESELDLASTIAHEYHHSVWTDRYLNPQKKETTLIDYIIFEGKAEFFKKLVYPDSEVAEIDKEKEEYYWNLIKNSLESTDYELHTEVMFGGGGQFPSLYGYGLGYRIIDSLLNKYPDLSIEEWSSMEPEDILNKSGFGVDF